MEDGLGVQHNGKFHTSLLVLILVLVEDGLGVGETLWVEIVFCTVLILVLVEDGLGDRCPSVLTNFNADGLNPCFSGGWSRR